jgi:hypothetical protein
MSNRVSQRCAARLSRNRGAAGMVNTANRSSGRHSARIQEVLDSRPIPVI